MHIMHSKLRAVSWVDKIVHNNVFFKYTIWFFDWLTNYGSITISCWFSCSIRICQKAVDTTTKQIAISAAFIQSEKQLCALRINAD